MTDPFDALVSQDVATRVLRTAVERDRLPSAYLFEGPSGVGKQRAAIALAVFVIARSMRQRGASAEAIAEVTRRIEAGAHPDVRIFGPREEGDRNIQVDTVREQILPFAQYAPFEADHAFLILPEADVSFPENHPEGANALLKTIEEPRPGVHFVLLAERPDRLLVTIRSRCQKVRFARLDAAALDAILARGGTPEDTRTAAVALADGRADRALRLAQEGAADALLESALRVDEIAARQAPGALVVLAEELAKHDELPQVLDALSLFYRDVAAAALGMPDGALSFRHRADRIRERAARIGAARAARACEVIGELELRLSQNANKEIALGKMLFDLGR